MNAGRSSHDKAVCPSVHLSVCLSVKHMICHNTKLICAHIFIPHERPIMLVLRKEEWLVGRPLLTELLGQADPLERKRRFSVDIRS